LRSPAIFLDRDGVINRHRSDYVKSVKEFELLPEVPHYLKQLQDIGFKLIIVTNQSAVNRGLISQHQLKLIHDFLLKELSKSECHVTDIFSCPHRPDENCECRKPKTKMFLDAAQKHSIDLSRSWVIGDNETDVEPGRKIGSKTIKINTNGSLEQVYFKIKKYSWH
jgi:D-glycero-D-manno-heptose 1,7-bisphosphate phosphatase